MNINLEYLRRNFVPVMTSIRARLISGKTEKLEVEAALFPYIFVGWYIYKTNFYDIKFYL